MTGAGWGDDYDQYERARRASSTRRDSQRAADELAAMTGMRVNLTTPGEWLAYLRGVKLEQTTRLIAYALASYAGWETGADIRPGRARLARENGVTDRTVTTHVGKLCRLGLLLLVKTARAPAGLDGQACISW